MLTKLTKCHKLFSILRCLISACSVIHIYAIILQNQDKNTVFVGKLNWSASEDEVQNLFSKYGNVTSVRLGKPHKPGQKNGGFAFVSFSDKAEYEAAIASENTVSCLFVS